MSASQSRTPIEDVSLRLRSIERRLGRERRAAAIVAAALIGLALGGAGPWRQDAPQVFEAGGTGGSLRIGIDEAGRPQIVLRDSGGHDRIELRIDEGAAPRVSLRDQRGVGRVELSLLDEATPRIMLLDERGQDRAKLFLMPDGSPLVYLKDEKGTPRAEMVSLGRGFHGFVVFDDERTPEAILARMPDGATTLRLRQPDGTIWRAPDPG